MPTSNTPPCADHNELGCSVCSTTDPAIWDLFNFPPRSTESRRAGPRGTERRDSIVADRDNANACKPRRHR